jgi:hypothetical protein
MIEHLYRLWKNYVKSCSNSHLSDPTYSRRGKYSHNFRKTAGTKIEISPFRYTVETTVFFIEHAFAAAISVSEEVLKSLTVL